MAGRERSAPTDGKAGRTPATAEPERATSPKGDGGTVAGPGTAVPVGGERATVDPRSERRTRVEETIGKDDDGRWSVTPRQRTERPTSGDRDPDELDRLRPVEAEEPPPSDHKNPPPSDHEEPLRDEAPADRTEVPPTDDHEADDDVEVTTPAPDDAPSTGDQGPDDDPGPAAPGPAPTPDTELATVVESSEVGGDWLYLADEGVWLDTETGAVHVTIGDRALSPDERGDLGLPPDGPVLIDARDIDWPSTPGQDQLADTGFHPGSAGPDAVYDPVTGLVYDHPGGDVVAVDPDRAVIVAGAVYNPDTGTLHGPDGTLDVGAVLTAADLTTVLGHEPPPGWNHPTSQDLPPGTTPTEGNQLVFADGTTLDDLAYDPVTGTVHRYDPDGWDTIDTPDGIIWINTDTGAVATHPNHDPYATLPQHPDGTYDTTTTPKPPPDTELATVVESSEVGGDWLYLADEGVWLDTETGAVHVTIGDRALSPDERGDLGLPPDGPVLIDARDIDWPSTPGQDQLADTGFHPGSAGPDAVYDPVTGLVYDHPGGDVVAVDPDRAVIVAGAVYNPDTGTLHGPDGTLDVGAVLTAADLTTVLGHEPPPGWNHPTSQDLPPGTTPTEGNQLVFADGTTLDDLAYDPVTGTVHRYDPDGWDTIDTPDGIIWINTDTGAVATHPNHDPYATLPQHPDGTYDTTTTPKPPPESDATGGGGVDPAADLGDDASAQVAATVDPDTESVDIDGPTEPSEEAPAADAASDDLADGDVGPGEDTEADVGSDGLGATDTGTLTFGAGTADASDASAGGAADTGTLAFGAGATDTSDALVGRAEDPPPGDVSADPTPVATHDGVGSSAVEHGILEDDAPLDDVEPPPLADEEPGDDGIDDDTVDDPVDLDG